MQRKKQGYKQETQIGKQITEEQKETERQKELAKEEKEYWDHVPDELEKLMEEFTDEEENRIEEQRINEETKCKMDMETNKEQTIEEKEHWNHVPDELEKLLGEFIDKQEHKTTGKVKCNPGKGTDKERHSRTETNDDTKTRAGTETKIAHKEENKSEKRPRDETEPGDKDKNKGETEAKTTTRKDGKKQDNKETTEDTKGREQTSWGK